MTKSTHQGNCIDHTLSDTVDPWVKWSHKDIRYEVVLRGCKSGALWGIARATLVWLNRQDWSDTLISATTGMPNFGASFVNAPEPRGQTPLQSFQANAKSVLVPEQAIKEVAVYWNPSLYDPPLIGLLEKGEGIAWLPAGETGSGAKSAVCLVSFIWQYFHSFYECWTGGLHAGRYVGRHGVPFTWGRLAWSGLDSWHNIG